MRPYEIRFTKEAVKDFHKLTPRLKKKLHGVLTKAIGRDPRIGKRLVGDLAGFYSFRLTFKDRIVYSFDEKSRTVVIHRTRTHYGD